MIRFNTTNLRNFVNKMITANQQTQTMSTQELNRIALDIADLLLYCKDLEDQIKDLNIQLSDASNITVELEGNKF